MASGDISVRHEDELKLTHKTEFSEHAPIDSGKKKKKKKHETDTETSHEELGTDSAQTGRRHTPTDNESHAYKMKLRSHKHKVLQFNSINEPSLETEFYEYVDEMLDELNIDRYSFYR